MALTAELDLQLDVIIEPSLASYAPILELAQRTPTLRIVINHIAMLPVTVTSQAIHRFL